METHKKCNVVIGICIVMMIGISFLASYDPNYGKETSDKNSCVSSSPMPSKYNFYHEIPFRIGTSKDEFDSLGIEFIFWTGTKKHLLDTLSHTGVKIPSWPKTREALDSLYPKIQESLWLPHVFMLYSDGYFIWNGTRTCVFTSKKRDYPTCKMLLIGDKEPYDDRGNYMFFTKEMYIVVY